MWTVKPAAIPVQYVYSKPPPRNHVGIHRRFVNIPTKSQTPESETVGGLGQQILLRTAESSPSKPISKEKEISGSDVLWAIQRATAQRKRTNDGKKKMKKIREGAELLSSAGESTGVDYSNVRPLRIKSDWGHRLEQFEKLLIEFHNTQL